MDPFILICAIAFAALVIAAIAGSYYHVHKAAFKPRFVTLSDGSVQMEFYNFGGLQTNRTQRFYEQYKAGMEIQYQNKKYTIADIKEVDDSSLLRPDKKMVAYLKETA